MSNFDKNSFVKVRDNIRKIDDNLLVINSMVFGGSYSLDDYNRHLKFALNQIQLILADFEKTESHWIGDKS